MTKDDIIRMAREADLTDGIELQREIDAVMRFAELIAAAEREACAKVCDVLAVHPEFASDITKLAAQAIRARSNHD